MKSIRHLLEEKGRSLVTIAPADTVQQALTLFAQHDIGAVLVLDGSKVVGIFSERDFTRRVGMSGRYSPNSPVREVMSHHVFCVSLSQTVEECLAIMTERHFRHLPVIDEQQNLLGIVSIGDLVKEMISLQAFHIEQLVQYITG